MKKLGKLSINPDRLMKNEELVHLRGGNYDTSNCIYCTVEYSSGERSSGYCCLNSSTECMGALLSGGGVEYAWC